MSTHRRYFHAPITSLESCNLIGSNRFLPGFWAGVPRPYFIPLAHARGKNRPCSRETSVLLVLYVAALVASGS